MADGKRRMADDGCEVRSGGCGDGESGETAPQAPSEEMSQECWDLVYGPSWPRSQATGIAGTSGGCEEGEGERSESTQEEYLTPQKAPNEAKLESTQSSLPLEFESSVSEPEGRERSRSREAVASGEWRVASGEWRVASGAAWLWGRRRRAQRADARGVPGAAKGAQRSRTGINAKLVAAGC